MKICKNCEYHKQAPAQVGPNQMAMVDLCEHSECANPVTGEPLACGQARSNADMCGLFGKRYKEKEDKPTTPQSIRDNVIQLVK